MNARDALLTQQLRRELRQSLIENETDVIRSGNTRHLA